MGRNLDKRLRGLEDAQVGVGTITRLEKTITKWQLVEFRTTLEMIVSRLEASSFEIAVFGRVSSGKSSLLNHIAGIDALPVGVTPVTAVPTRLVSGDVTSVIVSLAETRPMSVELELLWEYASEEGNPGNNKHVTSILVKLPSPRLKQGIVFVDTPGVGSLALAGGAETEDRRALVERVPGLIADAVVSSQEHASESDIGGVIEEALFGRGREAHDIIAG